MTYLQAAHEQCEQALNRLLELFGSQVPVEPRLALAVKTVRSNYRIQFNRRFTRRMGDAAPAKFRLRFSAPLWPRATDEERHNTVTHELAHLVAEQLRPGTGHGLLWRRIHRAMGGDGERCHAIDRTGLARHMPRPHVYACACMTHRVTERKHRSIRRYEGTARCKKCKETVSYEGRVDR